MAALPLLFKDSASFFCSSVGAELWEVALVEDGDADASGFTGVFPFSFS